MKELRRAAVEQGFASEDEFYRLVAATDLSQLGALSRFTEWKTSDGTKAGLLALFPELEGLQDAAS